MDGGTMLIRGGTVWTPAGPRRADVRTEAERIAEVGTLAPRNGETVIDAAGLHVLPGMADVHVHVDDRIGRFELADTFLTASRLALRTGITTIAGFVTQRPGETLVQAVERVLARARGRTFCDVAFHLTPTSWPWDWPEVERLVASGFSTFKLYTTYREAGLYTDYARLGEVMGRLTALGARLLVHCEDDAILAGIDEAVDFADPRAHVLLRPKHAEVVAVERVLELAERTRCPVHVVHVSSAQALERVAAARGHVRVTCETAPQYLLLTEAALEGPDGHRYLCTPPLRAGATRARLEAAAVAGSFDLFATDHCAFTKADKDGGRGDLREVPMGIAGIGALVPLLFELLVKRHSCALGVLADHLAAGPARLLGTSPRKGAITPGADADLVVVDPDGPPRPVVSTLADAYETYPGRTTTLDVRAVVLRGRVVAEHNAVLASGEPTGRALAGLDVARAAT